MPCIKLIYFEWNILSFVILFIPKINYPILRDICQWLNQCIQQSLSFDIFLPNQILSCRNQLMYCFQETVATPKKTDIFPKKIFKSTPNLNTAVWATDILQKIFELRNHEKKEHQRFCEKHPIYLICKSTGFYLIGVLFTNELRCLYRLRCYYTWKNWIETCFRMTSL